MIPAATSGARICRRVYKPAMPHDKASAISEAGAGQHFDPDLVAAFTRVNDEFETIAERFRDSDGDIREKAQRFG
jgi:putative two-component system response regulator